jgi:hypothetical protein
MNLELGIRNYFLACRQLANPFLLKISIIAVRLYEEDGTCFYPLINKKPRNNLSSLGLFSILPACRQAGIF